MAVLLAVAGILLPIRVPAQYLYLDANGNGVHDPADRLQAGTTTVNVYLNTHQRRDGSAVVCDYGEGDLLIASYEIVLQAEGGTVSWGTFTDQLFAGTIPTVIFIRSPDELTDPVTYHNGVGAGWNAPGLHLLCTIPITIVTGCPSISVIPIHPQNGAGYTSFGTDCEADDEYSHTYILGRNWFDADGLGAPLPSPTAPTIAGPSTASGEEGDFITFSVTATDPDPGTVLSISATGVPASLTLSTTPGPSPNIATISGTLSYDDAGTHPIVWTVSDGTCGNSSGLTTTLTVTNTDRAPVVFAPLSLEAEAGTMLTIDVTAIDPDQDAIQGLGPDLSGLPQTGGAVFRLNNPERTSGTLTWTPTVYDVGETYLVRFQASNALSGSDTTEIHVNPGTITAVESEPASPRTNDLRQNVPNPFNPMTEIRFRLERPAHVRLDVFTAGGKRVATLLDAPRGEGDQAVTWDGRDDLGRSVGSGVYFYRLRTDGFEASRRMVLLR